MDFCSGIKYLWINQNCLRIQILSTYQYSCRSHFYCICHNFCHVWVLRTSNSVVEAGTQVALVLEQLSFPKDLSIFNTIFSSLIALATPYYLLVLYLLVLILLTSGAYILLVLISLLYIPFFLQIRTYLPSFSGHGSIAWHKMYQRWRKYYPYNDLFSHIWGSTYHEYCHLYFKVSQ